MTKLEEVAVSWRRFLEKETALAAAKLDNEALYRQWVDDGRIAYLLDKATNWLNFAKRCIEDEDQLEAWEAMLTVKSLRREAFNGARGISRVEIRQRLERLKGTDNG